MNLQRSQCGLFLVVLLSVACGLEPGSSQFDDQVIEAVDDNGEPLPDEALGEGTGAGTMAGTWMLAHQASSCVLGFEQVTHAYYLIEIEEAGAGLRETRTLCELSLTPLLGFTPVASQEVLASIEFPPIDYGLLPTLLPGGTYTSSTEVGLWGVTLDNPVEDSLPTDPDDERVIDGDGDGNPGVSMALEGSGCSRFMGQRQIVRYFGTLQAPNDIRGQSATVTDTVVYGASGSVCQLAPAVDPNDALSQFRMVRVDGRGGSVQANDGEGPITCEDIARFTDLILPVREADDEHC